MDDGKVKLKRTAMIEQMEQQEVDVLIIGGGITGCGIALDAQTRGMTTALIDMQDFAAGTSSRSTKLVHGGLRYLKQLEFKVVAEVGRERAVVFENGPHVTAPEWMLLPIYKGGTFGMVSTRFGLMLYDRLAGVKKGERRRMLGVEATLGKAPLLKRDGLKGSGYYVEYRTDDARLTIEVLKRAVEHGALAANYMQACELIYENGRVAGCRAKDLISGRTVTIRAGQVVNATGPWVDAIRDMDGSKGGKTLRLTKGVHLVFDHHRFPLKQAIYFDTPDKRMVFAIPRDGKTYVGTTDTDYAGDTASPTMSGEDRAYLLHAANFMFPSLHLDTDDVESSWAGLRPLIYEEGKSPSEVSRKDEIFHSGTGLMTIAGGKLTGYRKMAEEVTDVLSREWNKAGRGMLRPCQTKKLPLSGGDVGGASGFESRVREWIRHGVQLGLASPVAERLARRYGSNVDRLFAMISDSLLVPDNEGFYEGLPLEAYLSLHYAIDGEMAMTPADYLIRRTGALYFDIAFVQRWKHAVVRIMARELHYSDTEVNIYTEELERQIRDAGGVATQA